MHIYIVEQRIKFTGIPVTGSLVYASSWTPVTGLTNWHRVTDSPCNSVTCFRDCILNCNRLQLNRAWKNNCSKKKKKKCSKYIAMTVPVQTVAC